MEGNRASQSSSKAGPFRSDKVNNVSGQESKQFPSSPVPSVDAASATASAAVPSSVTAKTKSFPNDKRSGRSGYNANYKNAERGGQVARPEIGSVARPGSKKGNAVCDFVQFAYEKRRNGGCDGPGGHRSGGGGRYNNPRAENYSRHQNYSPRNRHQSASYGPSYNKEQYLQATCQFVVMEGFNYGAHLSDADLIVDWDHIEELRLLVDEIPSCPICLYPPVAAKITRCGHVFCWPCILHYLALSDKTWRKCPICYESVYKNQLKSVVALQVARLSQGGEMTMRLMRRDKGSNLVLPAADTTPHRRIKPINGSDVQFSKLVSITHGQVIEMIVERERTELVVKLADEEHEPEACFIHEALECLQEREKLLKTQITKSEKSPVCGSPPTATTVSPFSRDAADVVTFIDAFNDEKRSGGSCSVRSAQSAPAAVTASARFSSGASAHCDGFPEESGGMNHGVETLAAAATAVATVNDKSYHFYQAEDGQQVYLHPVSARCFIHQYGSLANAPQSITGEIADIESFVMTEDLRRRFRYLAHLPLTSTFTLVELKLPRDVLSEGTVQHFAADFGRREEARQRKAKEEKRQQTQAERWERAVMLDPRNFSKFVSASSEPPEIPIMTYVPSAQRDIEAAFADSSDPPPVSNGTALDVSQHSSAADLQASTPSFAQMLRQGKPKPAVQPPQQSAAQSEQRIVNGDLGELDEEQREFLHLHSFQDAFGDALQSALDSYRNSNNATTGPAAEEGTESHAGKRKKKKTKGRLLFATGAAAPGMH